MIGFSIDDRVVRAYTNIGRVDKVIDIWQKASLRQPENTKYHLSLAAALAQVGETELAIKEIERATEIDPSLKEQGESFIQELRAGTNP